MVPKMFIERGPALIPFRNQVAKFQKSKVESGIRKSPDYSLVPPLELKRHALGRRPCLRSQQVRRSSQCYSSQALIRKWLETVLDCKAVRKKIRRFRKDCVEVRKWGNRLPEARVRHRKGTDWRGPSRGLDGSAVLIGGLSSCSRVRLDRILHCRR